MADAKTFTKEQQLGAQRKSYRRRVASAKTWARLQDERYHGVRFGCVPADESAGLAG